MRDACEDLTQNKKFTPTHMHHAIGHVVMVHALIGIMQYTIYLIQIISKLNKAYVA
jgi:hypothetical protein